ncbi:MAG: hypothetical protein PHH98_04160 [Candidatus Gracilibacteria bacterium]|nr:hypothetical protein [Candidatus Gracilibacteria bacterium]
MKNKLKYIGIILLIIFVLSQSYAMYIDMYNFRQLEKVKIILKDLKREDKQFFNLNEFNKIYNVDIQPIKNCYYLRNYKSEDRVPYTFGFELESLIYTFIYGDDYYSNLYKYVFGQRYYTYPKYDLQYVPVYDSAGVFDGARSNYDYLISHPCEKK